MSQVYGSPFILVVEDDWFVRDELCQELRREGWAVLESSSGEGALAFLRSGETITAVITGIQLAGNLDGWDVADAYRAANPHIPVIYVSGVADGSGRRMVDGSLFFPKPYVASVLSDACDRLGRAAGSEF